MSLDRQSLRNSTSGAVAPTIAMSLFALIAVGGIAFDYARLAGLDTDLQNAADQAALSAASQLDGRANACLRAANSARTLITNNARFANDGAGLAISVANETGCDASDNIRFYQDKAKTTAATSNDNANYVEITVGTRTANYALTPIANRLFSSTIAATAYAGVGQAICKVPPVMLCNPDEPAGNKNENYAFNPAAGVGLKLITGNASQPGNFGWLEATFSNGANGLAAALGYDSIQADCQQVDSIATKTGMDAAVLKAFNTRFDIYANGNTTCPQQYGGICSPSINSRKDLVCTSNNGTSCNNNASFDVSPNPYRPTTVAALTGSYPDIMGFPRDLCHAVKPAQQSCGIVGSGTWDRDAYFRVNYNWTSQGAWTGGTGLSASATRYDVYKWEILHPSVVNGSKSYGIGVPQVISGKITAFGSPATGTAGITPGGTTSDRRVMSIAVVNCRAATIAGKTSGIRPPKWLDVFLVEPAIQRGNGANAYTDQKEIYVEVIGTTGSGANGATNTQVVQRSVPYLIE